MLLLVAKEGDEMESQWIQDGMVSRRRISQKSSKMIPHYHDIHELYYLLEGQTRYLIDEEIYTVEKGDFVFVPGGSIHGTDYAKGKDKERILIYFGNDLFDEYSSFLQEKMMPQRLIQITKEHLPEIEALLLKIESEYYRNGEGKDCLLRLYIKELLILINRYRCERKTNIRETDEIIYEIAEYIRQHYDANISLVELSRIFCISDAHLSRKFKTVMGIGINQFVTVVRINKSIQMLENSRLTITEVARQCGYDDSNYFAAVFKKIKGVTPQKYRKQSATYQRQRHNYGSSFGI